MHIYLILILNLYSILILFNTIIDHPDTTLYRCRYSFTPQLTQEIAGKLSSKYQKMMMMSKGGSAQLRREM